MIKIEKLEDIPKNRMFQVDQMIITTYTGLWKIINWKRKDGISDEEIYKSIWMTLTKIDYVDGNTVWYELDQVSGINMN